MTISGVSGLQSAYSPITQVSRTSGTSQGGNAREMGGVEGACPPPPPPGGGMVNAIVQALSAIGVTGSSSSTSTSDTESATSETTSTSETSGLDIVQAFGSFMETLMETQRAQGESDSTQDTESGEAVAVRGPGGQRGGPGNIEATCVRRHFVQMELHDLATGKPMHSGSYFVLLPYPAVRISEATPPGNQNV